MTEEFKELKEDYMNGEDIIKAWKNPIINALIAPILDMPIIGRALESGTCKSLEEHQKKNLEKLMSLITRDELITTQMVEDVPALIEFRKMVEATTKLISNDKIYYLANLFRNTVKEQHPDFDEYEEFLNKIEDLSIREIKLLSALQKSRANYEVIMEGKSSGEKGVEPEKAWKEFIGVTTKETGESEGMITAIISGTMRSGFVQYIPINYAIGIQGIYTTTPYFERFLRKILD